MRVALPCAESAATASFQYWGTSSGRSTWCERYPFPHTGMNAAATTTPTTTAGSAAPNFTFASLGASAATPAATNPASPSTRSGTARGVLRNARPAAVSENTLNSAPYGLGSSYGHAPIDTTAPTITSSTKNARCRHRVIAASASATTGTAQLAAIVTMSCAYDDAWSIEKPRRSRP